jgi:tricorn protease
MPITGCLPTRRTWNAAGRVNFVGWKDNGTLLFSNDGNSLAPRSRTVMLDLATNTQTVIPLDQCDDAAFVTPTQIVFTRLPMQGSHTDRYTGGTAQNLWRFTIPTQETPGVWNKGEEAKPLTADYAGTSKRPLVNTDRVYFTSDRGGFMNIWSMKPDGSDPRQHTKHEGLDIGGTDLDRTAHPGRIVYQLGADLRLLDLGTGSDTLIPITLASDLDQTRERWIDKPMSFVTASAISHDGGKVALTARGRVFVFPVKQGRVVDVDKREGIRYREARFWGEDGNILALSDETGEIELTKLPSNGVGQPERLSTDGSTVRWQTLPSPDGKSIAHTDKKQRLWIFDPQTKTSTLVEENAIDNLGDLAWSADSLWLAYVSPAFNQFRQVKLYNTSTKETIAATTDRYDSYSPQFSTDGKWLYFLSDRTLKSTVTSPWGPRAPEPFFDKPTKLYQIALIPGTRSPWQAEDEVHAANKKAEEKKKEEDKKGEGKQDDPAKPEEKKKDDNKPASVAIDPAGIMERIDALPVTNGNYANLMMGDGVLFWTEYAMSDPDKLTLKAVKIANQDVEVKTVVEEIKSAQLSGDRKKLLIRKGDAFHVIDAAAGKADLEKTAVDLSGWSLSVVPRDEWRQMYLEAWRLLRDYFYDANMHGVDWNAVREKYLPLVERVRDRRELADLLSQMTGELSALHHFVYGGDIRSGDDDINPGSLGAALARREDLGGYQVTMVYTGDPDEPQQRSPLAQPGVGVVAGDVILAVNGVRTLDAPGIGAMLRKQTGKQVLLRIKPAAGDERDVIVRPISAGEENALRYRQWEVQCRRTVEEAGGGDIGYIHLRAMGNDNFSEFARDFYPVYTRKGLIIDVRDNRGGNIDSWVLSRLLRKAWMYWNQHAGRSPSWNMQFAFRGHMVVLCNERTASDGEAFSEGFQRLGMGKVIGTRTWGGEIWLRSSNFLVDGGIATAGEFGVFGPEGTWLVEGHGVNPDIVVDNGPHATFLGEDAQLMAAIAHLQQLIKEKPVEIPPVPSTPDKSWKKKE